MKQSLWFIVSSAFYLSVFFFSDCNDDDGFFLCLRGLWRSFYDSLPALMFFEVKISSCTPVTFFRPRSVHSCLVS